MVTQWTSFLFMLLTISQSSSNLIQNGGFEEDGHWERMERSNMWTVRQSDNVKIQISSDHTAEGSCAIRFAPFDPARFEALWISQYAIIDNGRKSTEQYLQVSFWASCETDTVFRLQLDVGYMAVDRLLVKKDIQCSTGFTQTCLTIPSYGSVRAFMIYFVTDGKHDGSIFIDDVNVDFVSYLKENCPIYLESFPKRRHVLTSFLRPVRDNVNDVTLCTQMTLDRLPYLIETSKTWQGPISACVLIFEDRTNPSNTQLKQLMEHYYNEPELNTRVTFHIVFEDILNQEDATLYPVNFLRNIALENAQTEYVFFVDADIKPSFSETDAADWINAAKRHVDGSGSSCPKCAFIAPVFAVKCMSCDLPTTKDELIKRVNEDKDIEIFAVVSHSVVRYKTWFGTEEPYEVPYKQDMEPYFIVHRSAPLMYTWYEGYGRDKCAYSRDLQQKGYSFYVLPHAFLLNKPELKGSKTILSRSSGLRLDTFLTIAFHNQELEHGFLTTPGKRPVPHFHTHHEDYRHHHSNVGCIGEMGDSPWVEDVVDKYKEEEQGHSRGNKHRLPNSQFTTASNPAKSGNSPSEFKGEDSTGNGRVNVPETDDNIARQLKQSEVDLSGSSGVTCQELPTDEALKNAESKLIRRVPKDRLDIFIEAVMRHYGTYVYVEYINNSDALRPTMSLHMLEMIHPEAVIVFHANTEAYWVKEENKVLKYSLTTGLAESITRIKEDHSSPLILLLQHTNKQDLSGLVKEAIVNLGPNDIAVIQSSGLSASEAHAAMCAVKQQCEMFVHRGETMNFITIKSVTLQSHHTLKEIEKPIIATLNEPLQCEPFLTDVVVITKNRPLQTFAFLESLDRFASGVNVVWVFYQSDDDIFTDAYNFAQKCSKKFNFETKFIQQRENMGTELLEIYESSKSDCVITGVDEMIWLQPMKLSEICCYLHSEDSFGSMQLRLGNTLGVHPLLRQSELFHNRMHTLQFDDSLVAFYPEYMLYDFGYVLNLDGLMVRTQQFLDDFSEVVSKAVTPARFEGGLIVQHLRVYARKWHLMYTRPRTVNNMYLPDGRVEKASVPSDESYQLAYRFLQEHKKLNVVKFADENTEIVHPHQSKPIDFIDNDCHP